MVKLSRLADVLKIDITTSGIHICMASLTKPGGLPSFQEIHISKNLAKDFRGMVDNVFAKRRKDMENGDLVLHDYDPGSKPDSHEVEYLDLSDYESIRSQLETLVNLDEIEAFEVETDFVSALRFYVIVLQPKTGKPIYCFRLYTPKKELNRSKLFAIVLKQGHFDRFTDDLFLFDQYIDCVCRGSDMFIFNKDKFQKIFQFYELLLVKADEVLGIIKSRIPIDNFDEFEKACQGHLQKIAKLKNIASKPYISKITIQDIKMAIEKFYLKIDTVGNGRNEKLHFDSSDKWAILRLLDDDYLESVMTGNNYEVNSKRPLI